MRLNAAEIARSPLRRPCITKHDPVAVGGALYRAHLNYAAAEVA